MSGLREHFPEFGAANSQVQPSEIDSYDQYFIFGPSVDTAYMGTVSSATAAAVVVLKNAYPDVPRNLTYSATGVSGGMGGTFTARGQDQFGGTIVETTAFASANGGGTVTGTAIFAKLASAVFTPVGLGGTAVGTASIGFSTATGAPSSNGQWFGLPTKIGGTADIKRIVWITTNTPTTLAAGTAIGTLVNIGGTLPAYAFQGTSGVAITDRYLVTYRSTYDNSFKQNLAGI